MKKHPLANTLFVLFAGLPTAHATAVLLGDTSGDARGAHSIDIQAGRAVSSEVTSGESSVAVGRQNAASGWGSMAFGINNHISGALAAGFGLGNALSGSSSVAVGQANSISGESAFAGGFENTINDDYGVAVGWMNTISGIGTGMGFFNTVGDGGLAFGGGNQVLVGITPGTSDWAIAVGGTNQITATGINSFAFGRDNIISAANAGAIGTGISNSTANSVMIGPSNSAKVTILSSGNLGVGTATPSEKLEVSGNVKIGGALTTTGAFSPGGSITVASGQSLTLNNAGTAVSITSPGSNRLQFNAGGASFEARAGGIVLPSGNKMLDANGNPALAFGSAASSVNYIQLDNAATTAAPTVRSAGTDTNIGLSLAPKGSGNVTIASGNLGIGISNPVDKLAVLGNGLFAVTSGAGTVSELLTLQTRGTNAAGTAQRITGYTDVLSGYLEFKRFASGGPSTGLSLGTFGGEALTIRSSGSADAGSVGIGTSSPAAKLDVVGGVQVAGDIRVKSKGVIRVSPAGDIAMGSFMSGTNPE